MAPQVDQYFELFPDSGLGSLGGPGDQKFEPELSRASIGRRIDLAASTWLLFSPNPPENRHPISVGPYTRFEAFSSSEALVNQKPSRIQKFRANVRDPYAR